MPNDPTLSTCVGMPYEYFGTCFAFVQWVADKLGTAVPRYGTAPSHRGDLRLIARYRHCVDRVLEPCAGDFVEFTLRDHIAIMIDSAHFLHCQEGAGVVRVRTDNPDWAPLIKGYWRWKS